MLSRILGLVRDQLLAAFMGAGALQDAYQVAFRLPNMFRRLFGEGAFNAAFVPLFSSVLTREGKEEAQLFARRALGVMLVWLLFLCVLGEIFMPQVLKVIAPRFLLNILHKLSKPLNIWIFPQILHIQQAMRKTINNTI